MAGNLSFVLRAVKDVAFEDRAKPKLRDHHDVIVHVSQTGICGSDVHYWQRGRIGNYILTGPMVLGHESSGVVAEVGSLVKHLKVGDRVAMEPEMIFAATPPWDGTLAKYYVNASDFCYKVPDSMDMEESAMVEPVAVACAINKTADVRAHQTVIVMGCGPIGILSQAVAKQSGAKKVIGVDIVQSRLDLAAQYGADETFMPPRPEPGVEPIVHAERVAGLIREKFNLDDGADVVLECSGAEACIQMGIFATKPGGTFTQAGMGKENVLFPITHVCTQALVIKGSIRYLNGCYPAAIDLISTGKINVKRLITNRYKFEQAEEAFELVRQARQDVFKVMIEGVQ
uniref:L-arabinitol 4-dehydrogenase n=1 Tax=Bionectria ochroleuca TaxID=29856 RepID=A0A8H7K337_BIOOC